MQKRSARSCENDRDKENATSLLRRHDNVRILLRCILAYGTVVYKKHKDI